jgi:hypothetical protein
MIYYSKQKEVHKRHSCYITKQRCSIEKSCSKKRKDYGRTNEKKLGNAFLKASIAPLNKVSF